MCVCVCVCVYVCVCVTEFCGYRFRGGTSTQTYRKEECLLCYPEHIDSETYRKEVEVAVLHVRVYIPDLSLYTGELKCATEGNKTVSQSCWSFVYADSEESAH